MEIPLNRNLTDEEQAQVRDSLKRCSEETIQAAINYREEGDKARIPTIVEGIAERFLEPEIRPRLKTGDDNLRILEDLGIDSLTMVEVVMLVEEILGISIKDEELKGLRTIGDVKGFIDAKVSGIEPENTGDYFPVESLLEFMPQQPPFLFLQGATITEKGASGDYQISGGEYFLEGHFKDNPVFPASIMLESLGQLGVAYLLKSDPEATGGRVDPACIFFTSCDGLRIQRMCKPGDKLHLEVDLKRLRHPLATFSGQILSGNEKVAFAEEITLTFDFSGGNSAG